MATIDTSTWDKIRPLSVRQLIRTCPDSKLLGDILRRIGGQQVDLDEHTIMLMNILMTPSQEAVEFRKRDAERHARYVARKRAEDEEAVDAAAKACVLREKKVAALKARHQELDDKYGAEIKALDADIKTAHERAAPYFEAHAGELCDQGKRSGSTKLALFGVRLGMPTVTKEGKFKKVAWKALGLIFDGVDKLKQFVRNQPEVNKDAILEVFRDLKSEDQDKVSVALEKKAILDEYGISMEQNDEFWIEPKADDQVK